MYEMVSTGVMLFLIPSNLVVSKEAWGSET